jgi:replicative DNA helicase
MSDPLIRKTVNDQLGQHLEGALIACAFSSNELLDTFDVLPAPGDFLAGWNPIIWECVLETRKTGEFSAARFIELLKGHGFAVKDVNEVISSVNKNFLYAEEVKHAVEFLLQRRLVLRSETCANEYLATLQREPFQNAPANLERLQRQLADVAAGAVSSDTWAFGDDVSSSMSPSVKTGWADYDEMTGGFELAAFGIIAARPSIGKSAAMCSVAHAIAARGDGVGVFSLEMRSYALQCRMAAARAYRPLTVMGGNSGNPYYEPFLKKRMPDGPNYRKMLVGLNEVRALPIAFDETKGLTVSEIRSRTRRLKAKMEHKGTPLRVLFVDHIGHVTPEKNRGGNKTQEVTDISKGLMDMAGELGIAVIGLSQLNRATESRTNKRPTLADLRDSGSLEQDAAHVTFLYRDEYYADRAHDDAETPAGRVERNTMELIVAKQRNGPVGTVKLFCEMGANAILDREDEWQARSAA